MVIDKYFFRGMYVVNFKATVDYYAKTLEKKVLAAFEDVTDEANKVEEEAFEKLGRVVDPEWYDPGDYWEAARDAGVDLYIMATGIKQGMLNLFSAGLYHLFEQWFFRFHRRDLLYVGEEGSPDLIKWKEAKARLKETYGIDIESFSSASKINELRLVANTVKHADGDSCADLKKMRPDLFVFPKLKDGRVDIGSETIREVFTPLAGEDVYIGIEDFKKYVVAVKEFWDELAAALDKYEYPKT